MKKFQNFEFAKSCAWEILSKSIHPVMKEIFDDMVCDCQPWNALSSLL